VNKLSFLDNGYELIDGFSSAADIDAIRGELDKSEHQVKRGGIRNAEKKLESVNALVLSTKMKQSAEKYLSGEPKLVRVMIFCNEAYAVNLLVIRI
jgi:hypothetical protein